MPTKKPKSLNCLEIIGTFIGSRRWVCEPENASEWFGQVQTGAAVRVLRRNRDQSRIDGVLIDVAKEYVEVPHTFDGDGTEPAAEERAVAAPRAIEPANVGVLDPPHRFGELPIEAPDEEMEVRREDRVGVDLDPSLVNGVGEKSEEHADVPTGLERGAPCNRTVHDVVQATGTIESRTAGHDDLRLPHARALRRSREFAVAAQYTHPVRRLRSKTLLREDSWL